MSKIKRSVIYLIVTLALFLMGHIADAETVEFPITVTYDYAKGAEFVSVLNQARKAAGLPAVIQTGTLTEIAKIRAREAQFWMEHGSPDASNDATTYAEKMTGIHTLVIEDLAAGDKTATEAFKGLCSDAHKADMYNKLAALCGVACAESASGSTWAYVYVEGDVPSLKSGRLITNGTEKVSASVNVFDGWIAFEYNRSSINLAYNEQIDLTGNIYFKHAAMDCASPVGYKIPMGMLSITSENDSIIQISGSKVTGTGVGSTKIKIALKSKPGIFTEIPVQVEPKTLYAGGNSPASIALEKTSFPYTGSAVCPKPVIKDWTGKVLVEGIDYRLEYSNNINQGSATVVAYGQGNYKDRRTLRFTITAPEIPQETEAPGKSVSGSDKEETSGASRETASETEPKSGIGTGTETGNGSQSTKETIVQPQPVVMPATSDISGPKTFNVSLSQTSFPYNGSAKQPNVTVTVDGRAVTAEKYVYTIYDNVNVGTATVYVEGRGVYEGYTGSAKFTITPASFISKISANNYMYTGKDITPTPAVYANGQRIPSSLYTVCYSSNRMPGKATIKIQGHGIWNGYKAVHIFNITCPEYSVNLRKASYTYNGRSRKPGVTVKVNNRKLKKKFYTVSYSGNKAVGYAKVVVRGKGNYSYINETLHFKIDLRKPVLTRVKSPKKKNMMSVAWRRDSSVQGYQLQYSLYANFKDAQTVTISNNRTTSTNIKGLLRKKRYYVRLRTFKEVGGKYWFSTWTGKKKTVIR